MQIEGPIPFAAAQATSGLAPVPSAAAGVGSLVAANVPGAVTFDGIAVQDMAPLQLYARAADRIEAATRLAVGRTVDITA